MQWQSLFDFNQPPERCDGARMRAIASQSQRLLWQRVFQQSPPVQACLGDAAPSVFAQFQQRYYALGGNNDWQLCLAFAEYLHRAGHLPEQNEAAQAVRMALLTQAVVDWIRLDKGEMQELVLVCADTPNGAGVFGVKRVDLDDELSLCEIEWESLVGREGVWYASSHDAESLQDSAFSRLQMAL